MSVNKFKQTLVASLVNSLVTWSLMLCLLCVGISTVAVSPAIAQPNANAITRLMTIKERFTKLEGFVNDENWTTIKTYIHGPFGQVRQDILLATGGLPGKARAQAKTLAKQFVDDLVKIDFAADDRDIDRTEAAFEQARSDFSQLVDLIENS